MNEDLNKLTVYKNRKCYKCGRSYPKTVLNIEGVIHHKMPFQCLDMKSCNRAKRKSRVSQGL